MIAPDQFELTIERVRQFLIDEQHQYGTAQTRLCFAKIKRIYKRCFIYDLGVVKVCEYRKMVVEGNHRFIAYKLAGIDFEVKPYTSSHCDVLKQYNEVSISEDDWDANHEDTTKYCDDDYVDKDWIKKK